MKILFIGFLALSAWIALSTYIYVCKIKGLCHEPAATEIRAITIEAITPEEVITADTLSSPSAEENAVIPKDLIIYFAFDKSEFNADAKTDTYIQKSKAFLDQNSQARLSFTGHTDAIGSDAYNQALGNRRAQSVQHYFESKGVPANNTIVESKGEMEPVDDNNTSAGRASNRRTVVTIIK
jgi:outer membrane protein OmpA-like peptidoglycan-associated protein